MPPLRRTSQVESFVLRPTVALPTYPPTACPSSRHAPATSVSPPEPSRPFPCLRCHISFRFLLLRQTTPQSYRGVRIRRVRIRSSPPTRRRHSRSVLCAAPYFCWPSFRI